MRGKKMSSRYLIGGCDEVGCSAIAGPIVAASVVFDIKSLKTFKRNVKALGLKSVDSKELDAAERTMVYEYVKCFAKDLSVGICNTEEFYKGATVAVCASTAMRKSVEGLATLPDLLVVDYRRLYLKCKVVTKKKGERIAVVGAASVVAKLFRDKMLALIGELFPEYDFESNKGYPSPIHKRELYNNGYVYGLHRRHFKYVRRAKFAKGVCFLYFKESLSKEAVFRFLEL